jgi:hypothetical protein
METGTGRDSFFRSAENSSEGIAGNVTPIVHTARAFNPTAHQGDQANKLIVIEASYETTSPTVDSQVVQIRTANPDIFINISTPKFAAQAIKKIGELKWNPVHFLTNVSVSIGSVMKPAGYENGQGILSASYLKDPKDPQWKNDPAMNESRVIARRKAADQSRLRHSGMVR